MKLMNFQDEAIDNISETFFRLWRTGSYRLPLIFKSPTGSGKTVMMADFISNLKSRYVFDEEVAYIWISFGGDDSYKQSKKKFESYSNQNTSLSIKDSTCFSEGELNDNSILFINWSVIKNVGGVDSRIFRKATEKTQDDVGIFDEFIMKTKKNRSIVLIVDEAHTESSSELAQEVLDLLNPRIEIRVTATPRSIPSASDIKHNRAGFVEVYEEDVIKSGLIKEKIIIQTEEDILSVYKDGLGENEVLLELAYNRRVDLKNNFVSVGSLVNPLVLIQLPNDYKEKENLGNDLKESSINYLLNKGVDSSNIAVWLNNENSNLNKDQIIFNDNNIEFLFFKQAAATGWDCPRASVLVMYREIKSPVFKVQVIGRIKRMPEAFHYDNSGLNYAYVYTNYSKNDIRIATENKDQNFSMNYAKRKPDIQTISLNSIYHNRVDYNSLTPQHKWQVHLSSELDRYFGVSNKLPKQSNISSVSSKLEIDSRSVMSSIVVNAEIDSYDNFITELIENSKSMAFPLSIQEVEKMYNLLCFNELKKQTDIDAKYNAARSWSPLKTSLNVWFSSRFGLNRTEYYPIIVNQLLDPNSHLKKAINISLKSFKLISIQHSILREPSAKINITIPSNEAFYGNDYMEVFGIKKNAFDKFFILKEYLGRENEMKFISFLESQEKVVWWHKQDNHGKDVFGVEYLDFDSRFKVFYPDFIIKTVENFYIVDTKAGITAQSNQTAEKNKSLQKWIENNPYVSDKLVKGGIVIERYPYWMINEEFEYKYENTSDWKMINFDN